MVLGNQRRVEHERYLDVESNVGWRKYESVEISLQRNEKLLIKRTSKDIEEMRDLMIAKVAGCARMYSTNRRLR